MTWPSTGAPAGAASSAGARPRRRGDDGYIMLEVLVTAVILVVGLLGLALLLDATVRTSAQTRAREGATNLARQILEDARTTSFAQISPGSIKPELQSMPGLADASSTASGWQVIQRGITYTVTVSDCSIDDPKDGYGVHENSFAENPFCSDSTATGTADSQPEDLKRISVDVTWVALGRRPDVHQVETLTAAGVAPGLAASGLHLQSPFESTEPVIETQPAGDALSFAVSAPASTVAMRWSLEGVAQTTAPSKSAETRWTFSWAIPEATVSDGTYTVSVQAIDSTGVLGPPVSIPVTLIRSRPAPVKNLTGGFNTVNVGGEPKKVVELGWEANKERNVIGYRVFDPSNTLVCPESETLLSVKLSCIDGVGSVAPPDPAASNLKFTAVALYRNAKGEVKEGPTGAFTVEGGPPPAPNPPATLSATKNPDGSVTLKWPLPSGGPAIKFFRIYRDSTDYTSRFAATESGTTTSFTDESATTTHKYWVTAVDANLTESSFVGWVSA